MTKSPDVLSRTVARTGLLLRRATANAIFFLLLLFGLSGAYPATGYAFSLQPELAIIIDDLGDSPLFVRKLAALNIPLNLSIIPHTRCTSDVLAVARDAGLEVILHQPMEPVSYPTHDPGVGALFTSMDAGQIQHILQENFTLVPGIVGMNNHMGSRFTQDEQRMELVLAALKRRGLFMIDSLTHPKSHVMQAAARIGVTCLVRDVFLDNVRTTKYVLGQLHKAEAVARRKGHAIAIGHPKPATLDALTFWSRHRDQSVRLVPISVLAQDKAHSSEKLAETHSAP